MSELKETMVNQFTLKSGKIILLREPEIGDNEEAAKIAGTRASADNQLHMGLEMQKELLKKLLVKIDDKALGLTDKENLKALLTYREYGQCMQALKQITGDVTEGNLEIKLVAFGGK